MLSGVPQNSVLGSEEVLGPRSLVLFLLFINDLPDQGRRRHTKSGPVVDNGECVGGAAPGRVWVGGTLPPSQGVWGNLVVPQKPIVNPPKVR